MKKKILIISSGLWPPSINVAGTKAVYNYIKSISTHTNFEIHILTAYASWKSPDILNWFKQQEISYGIKFHYVNASRLENIVFINLILTRILLLIKSIQLLISNNYDLVHEYISVPVLMYSSLIYKLFFKTNTFYTIVTNNNSMLTKLKPSLFHNFIDKIIFISNFQKESFTKENLRLADKSTFIPIGIDLQQFKCKTHSINENKQSLLYIGPLEERKGAFTFANACNLINKDRKAINFVIVSYGTSGIDKNHSINKKRIKDIIKTNLTFLEGKQDIAKIMQTYDIFIYPICNMHGTLSHPITLIEALASGMKCIISDIPELREISKYNKNTLYFKRRNYNDLYIKMKQLIDSNQIINNCPNKTFYKIYDIKHNTKKIIDLYNKK